MHYLFYASFHSYLSQVLIFIKPKTTYPNTWFHEHIDKINHVLKYRYDFFTLFNLSPNHF
jgi:hypothetical protein